MKAISLWQPWASAMMRGAKRYETRSWSTEYRGDLVICSAKRKPSLEECGDKETYDVAMREPYGCALCVVNLFDCRGVEWVVSNIGLSHAERELGDYTPGVGRYAWLTRNLRPLKKPVPVFGRQQLWNLPPEIVTQIKEQL